MSDDDKVKPIGIRFKAPPGADAPMLKMVDKYSGGACNHRNHFVDGGGAFGRQLVDVQYLIRDGETEVECGGCGAKLDPMWVLQLLAHKETQWERTRQRYHEEMQRLAKRSRTTCEHCGKMTAISRS